MNPKADSAHLLLRLYELRRDPVMREARDWFLRSFDPQSVQEVVAVATGPDNAEFRMVLGYWEMAASFVSHGAIDREMFLDVSTEAIPVLAKMQPLLPELRSVFGTAGWLEHLERVLTSTPEAAARLTAMREQLAQRRRAADAKTRQGE